MRNVAVTVEDLDLRGALQYVVKAYHETQAKRDDTFLSYAIHYAEELLNVQRIRQIQEEKAKELTLAKLALAEQEYWEDENKLVEEANTG